MLQALCEFCKDQNGATAIEYGLIACLIILVIVGSIGAVGTAVKNTLYNGLATLFG